MRDRIIFVMAVAAALVLRMTGASAETQHSLTCPDERVEYIYTWLPQVDLRQQFVPATQIAVLCGDMEDGSTERHTLILNGRLDDQLFVQRNENDLQRGLELIWERIMRAPRGRGSRGTGTDFEFKTPLD